MQIYIRPNGAAQCLYGEKIDLQQLGAIDIRRASHVEPDPEKQGQWYVDLSPVGGPVTTGYPTRAMALAFEEEWLAEKMRHEHVEASRE